MLGLEDLVVSRGARGTGIGRALMAALAREAVRRKAIRMEWDVLDWNADALRFYRRIGSRSRAPWLRYALDEKGLKTLARGVVGLAGTTSRSARPRGP